MYSVEELRENYKSFSNSKIERIARNDSKSLRKEVLAILKEEIKKRNLDTRLITWVEAETNTFTDIEKQSLIEKIKDLTCPECYDKNGKLSGYEINRVVSYFIYTDDTTKIKILCEECGRLEKLYSILTTLLAGWWSRRGLFITPYIIIKDLVNLFFYRKISNRILNDFIDNNTGILRLHGIEEKALSDLIILHNNNYETEED